jgi:hypothetical protein
MWAKKEKVFPSPIVGVAVFPVHRFTFTLCAEHSLVHFLLSFFVFVVVFVIIPRRQAPRSLNFNVQGAETFFLVLSTPCSFCSFFFGCLERVETAK